MNGLLRWLGVPDHAQPSDGWSYLWRYKLRPYAPEMRRFWHGNVELFGVRSALCTMSPLFDLFANWRYRHHSIAIALGDEAHNEREIPGQ